MSQVRVCQDCGKPSRDLESHVCARVPHPRAPSTDSDAPGALALGAVLSQRGLGHTFALLNGALAMQRGCLVLVANGRHAQMLRALPENKEQRARPITLAQLHSGHLAGTNRPIVVDHAALAMLLRGLVFEIDALKARLAEILK